MHPSATETTLSRAGRLAALLQLDDDHLVAGHTLQELADALGVGNCSTISRDLALLPKVRAIRFEARRQLRLLPERSTR